MNNTKQSMAKSGNLNPMCGKRHSTDTKKKISDSQKQRYETIRKALKEQDILTYGKDANLKISNIVQAFNNTKFKNAINNTKL